MTNSTPGASSSSSPTNTKPYVVHQHHHYGWTMNTHLAGSPEEAMRNDLLKYHPWLSEYGHKVSFSDGRYKVEYAGEPYPRAYYTTPSWARMGDYWFGERIHIGSPDDCNKCGGTGVNHYYPWRQCWACGNGETKGKSSGKKKAQVNAVA